MVKIFFVPCEFNEEIFLDEKSIKLLKEKNFKQLFLFSAIQFNTKKIEEQLKRNGIKVKKAKAKRTLKKGQILGCDCYEDSFDKQIFQEEGEILYVGDGLFHPLALLIAQKENFRKRIFIFNPIRKELKTLEEREIEDIKKRLIRNLRFYLNSEKVGLIVSTKFGQQYLNSVIKLKKELEKKGKKVFIFVCDFLDFKDLENFPFIKCWVNSACPRIGFDDILLTEKPLINVREAFNAEKTLDKLENQTKE